MGHNLCAKTVPVSNQILVAVRSMSKRIGLNDEVFPKGTPTIAVHNISLEGEHGMKSDNG